MSVVLLLPALAGWTATLRGHAVPSPLRVVAPTMTGLLGRLRNKPAEQIAVGAKLPSVEVDVLLFDLLKRLETKGMEPPELEDGLQTDVPTAVLPITEALGNGTSILVGMPGAFTPTCNDQHLPGFVRRINDLRTIGVERVAVLTTNDRFVNSAWNKAIEQCVGLKSKLLMVSDGEGDLVKALGLVEDMGFGLGFRSKRFVLVVRDDVVQHVAVDEGMDELKSTSAEAILRVLGSDEGSEEGLVSWLAEQLDVPEEQVVGGAAVLLILGGLALFS